MPSGGRWLIVWYMFGYSIHMHIRISQSEHFCSLSFIISPNCFFLDNFSQHHTQAFRLLHLIPGGPGLWHNTSDDGCAGWRGAGPQTHDTWLFGPTCHACARSTPVSTRSPLDLVLTASSVQHNDVSVKASQWTQPKPEIDESKFSVKKYNRIVFLDNIWIFQWYFTETIFFK